MSDQLQSNIPNLDMITDREISKAKHDLRNEFNLLVDGLKESLITRLDAMDKASVVLSENVNRVPTLLDREVATIKGWTTERFAGLENVMGEKFGGVAIKFDSIATQFAERDKRTEQLSLADKTAIAAALQAQKEDAAAKNESNSTATTKMEANFAKQIDQTQQLLQEMRRSTDDKINDIKSRLDKGEGATRESRDTRTESHANIGSIASVAIAVFGGLSFLVAVTVFVMGSNHNNSRQDTPAALAVAPLNPSAVAPGR